MVRKISEKKEAWFKIIVAIVNPPIRSSKKWRPNWSLDKAIRKSTPKPIQERVGLTAARVQANIVARAVWREGNE